MEKVLDWKVFHCGKLWARGAGSLVTVKSTGFITPWYNLICIIVHCLLEENIAISGVVQLYFVTCFGQSIWCTSVKTGRGNSTVVSVSVYQAGDPGSRPPRSACHRKVRFYHCVIDSLPPVLTTGSKKVVHVLLCLCNNACKRSLAICRKNRALCPVSRLLSVPI